MSIPEPLERRDRPVPRQRPLLPQWRRDVRADELGAGDDRPAHHARAPIIRWSTRRRRRSSRSSTRAFAASSRAASPPCRARAVHRALLQGAGGRMIAGAMRFVTRLSRCSSQLRSRCSPARRRRRSRDPAKLRVAPVTARAAHSIRCWRTSRSARSTSSGRPPKAPPASFPTAGPSRRSRASRRRLRAQCLRRRRGARLRVARRRRARACSPRCVSCMPRRRARSREQRRLPGLLLSLPQFRQRQALRQFRTIDRRHGAAHGRRVVCRRIFRSGRTPTKRRSASSPTNSTGA